MNIQTIILVIINGILFGCELKVKERVSPVFTLPEIVNTQFVDTIQSSPVEAEYISEIFPAFVGKYKFQEKIDVNPEKSDTTIYKDKEFIKEYSRIGLNDSIDVNGFELIIDYETTVKYNKYYEFDSALYDHYPVYFVNSTKTEKMFLGKDSYVFGIQEAQDSSKWGTWRPIEGRGFDFCGNGYWGLIVYPQEYVMVLMQKYKGDFETGIRVRFELGESIYVSKPFQGKINKNQFAIQDSSYLERNLQETEGKAAAWLFYGAVPNEEEWAVKTF